MIGANTSITTYRLTRASNKDTFAGSATLDGVPVHISQVPPERAVHIDQRNVMDVYRMESDRDLDIEEGDKVTDSQATPVTYRVSHVRKEPRMPGTGVWTVCILKKKK